MKLLSKRNIMIYYNDSPVVSIKGVTQLDCEDKFTKLFTGDAEIKLVALVPNNYLVVLEEDVDYRAKHI